IDLGEIPSPFAIAIPVEARVEAVDVSGDGGIVVGMQQFEAVLSGTTDKMGDPFAVIWDKVHGLRRLEDVLRYDYGLGADGSLDGWQLGEVAAISDDGTTIVGTGVNSQGEQEAWRAVLWTTDHAPGDADFDGDVDDADYATLMSHIGMGGTGETTYWSMGDFDRDGRIDYRDFRLLKANYQGSSELVFVPEPATMTMLAVWIGCVLVGPLRPSLRHRPGVRQTRAD
ncbi:MAG: hypothetical protein KDA99_15785, partial [Planctomycetales bacterium]|nr:hypothetical protein [Planctomycetales bacterium]